MRRVHIVGAGGSGKTTLGGQLGEALGVPFYELDLVAYEGGAGRKRTFDERMALLGEIVGQPGWVTEGGYLWWTDELLQRAELIVWLDLPWYVAISRIVARHAKASWAGTNRHPGLLNLARFVWGYRGFYLDREPDAPDGPDDDAAGNRAAIGAILGRYSGKLVRCRRPADVIALRQFFVSKA